MPHHVGHAKIPVAALRHRRASKEVAEQITGEVAERFKALAWKASVR
jgi:hypothetical protein